MKSAFMRLIGWFGEFRLGARPAAPYGQRSCQGAAWRRAFSTASKQDLRDFLEVFVSAFAFRSSSRLNFSPDDPLLAIYRMLYPSRWTPDALELETLAQQLEQCHKVQFALLLHDRLTWVTCLRRRTASPNGAHDAQQGIAANAFRYS